MGLPAHVATPATVSPVLQCPLARLPAACLQLETGSPRWRTDCSQHKKGRDPDKGPGTETGKPGQPSLPMIPDISSWS